jgi:hypothetical protein
MVNNSVQTMTKNVVDFAILSLLLSSENLNATNIITLHMFSTGLQMVNNSVHTMTKNVVDYAYG